MHFSDLVGRSGFVGLIALLLAVPALAQAPQAATSPPPAAAAQAAASAPQAAASAPEGVSTERLKREIDSLRGLVEGRVPQDMALPSLFEINLEDPTAVAQRVQALKDRLASPTAAGELEALRRARDTLRLSFLNLPPERRDVLREQDRLKRQADALAVEKKQSVAVQVATEVARDSALAVASSTTDDTARVLATEEARLLAHLSEMAALRQGWVEHKQQQLARFRSLLAHFGADGSRTEWTAPETLARYLEIRQTLRQLRADADQALNALDLPSAVVPLDVGPALNAAANATHAAALARVRDLRARNVIEKAALVERELDARYAEADDVMSTLRALQARRIVLLSELDPAQRAELSGFNSEGLDRVLSEVSHVRLMMRWYPVQRLHEIQSLGVLLKGSLSAGQFGLSAFTLVLTLALIAMVLAWRQGRTWLVRLRLGPVARITVPSLHRLVDGLVQMLIRTSHELIVLFAVYLLFDQMLVGHVGLPELAALRSLAYAYAGYRLALAFIHRVLLGAVSRYRVVDPSLNAKILRSLRLVTRVVLVFAVYLIVAQALLGRGALYGIAQEVAIAGVLVVGWRLIVAWRDEVTQAYLSMYPEGRLADRLRAIEGRSHGLIVASAAFVFVASRGLWIWLRDTALRFEQTRKALAYLFRRKLERQSKSQGAAQAPSDLPQALQEAFTEDAIDDARGIDFYPELDEVLALATSFAGGESGALIALTGERGVGKTSWLLAFKARIEGGMPCVMHSFEERDPSVASVCRLLCALLDVESVDEPDALIKRVHQSPARVVLLDLVQNTMLRDVGGLAGHEALLRVAQGTVGKVLWVLAYARWPFEYLLRTQPGRDVYDRVVTLRPWSEEQIGELITARMERAGFSADYEQLMLNPTPSHAATFDVTERLEAMERSTDRYHRLVWDYADGNPRIALHFFRQSLVWKSGKQVTVRLFAMPSMEDLEAFETQTWFVLACLVQHENLTIAEAAASLRFPTDQCARALQLLHGRGFLSATAQGRYRVSSHWARAVQRFLQRKKLLVV